MKTIRFFIAFTICTGILSCTPESDDDTVYNSCQITRSYTQGDTSQTSTYWIYSNGHLSLLNMPGPGDLAISYNGNVVTVGDASSFTRFYLRPDSLAYGSARYIQGGFIDTVVYQYDAEGYRVKEVTYSTLFGKDSALMTYVNGNMTAYRWYSSNGFVTYGDFTYHTTPSKHWFYNNMGPTSNNSFYFPWLGKPNRHLIKSYSSNFNGSDITDNLTYTLNASGYVTSFTGTGTNGSYSNYYEYQCQ